MDGKDIRDAIDECLTDEGVYCEWMGMTWFCWYTRPYKRFHFKWIPSMAKGLDAERKEGIALAQLMVNNPTTGDGLAEMIGNGNEMTDNPLIIDAFSAQDCDSLEEAARDQAYADIGHPVNAENSHD